ncbi:MAG: M1 family metallopeptidase [Limisphaerales bacterium]
MIRSKRILSVAATVAFTLIATPPTTLAAARQYAPSREVDIQHLVLDLTPDFTARTMAATAVIRLQPISAPLRELKLDAVDLRVSSITATEPLQAWHNDDRQLALTFAKALPAGHEVTVTIAYTAQPEAGLYFRTPAMGYREGDTHLFTQGEAITSRNWFPCFDAPNEKFTSEVTCRVPAGMTAISNGRLVAETPDATSGLTAFHWSQEPPHTTYLIALVAGHFQKLEETYQDIPLAFYTPPSEFAHAARSFAGTRDMLAYFEQEIGVPYP